MKLLRSNRELGLRRIRGHEKLYLMSVKSEKIVWVSSSPGLE